MVAVARYAVSDIASTARYLRDQGVPIQQKDGRVWVGPEVAEGAILEFVPASARERR